ncbi:Sphingomyelin phosphodiesterase [Purpureocillium takamizusanense]|uniref:Sphingomyelin phosphodiesterase n=1 Tax=Purpureocillium takamizusanense TaxID=2060973 RepID=A0A9Q8V9Y6_9HYPO|nr:Sphingomyelin phosphodiesterase [Purpureocillium takamizusanense]UNI18800.1 Sphingomyelin phosphodiesterase [Purpureocillium takamizusanense]
MRSHALLALLALGRAAQGAALGGDAPITDVSPRDGDDASMVSSSGDLQARGLVEDIWNEIKNAATCAGCETVLGLLKVLVAFGDGPFVSAIQDICKLAKVQDDDVCDGSIALEGPIIAAAIRKMHIGSRTSEAFCTTLLGLCGYPAVASWDVPFPSPKPAGGRPKPSGKPSLKIVHYSDIHVDPLYESGSSTNCTKPICCRPYTDADKPGTSKSPAGPNGDHKCDTPVSLEDSMYKAINAIVPDAAFTLFTGDIVDHAIWNTTQASNTDSIQHAYAAMNQTLKLVYGTAGNHEAQPVNSFPPSSISSDTQWLYNLLSQEWAPWLDQVAESDVAKFGAYSTRFPGGNLRIISINTNLYYRHNFWLYQDYDDKDPNLQIAWLVKELDAAERAGEHVYIIGHMPMGEKDALPDPSNYLDQVFKRYSSTIAAMFFGHTHVDHFEVSYLDYAAQNASNAYMTSYIAPSLTPTSGMPSFRVYDVDPDTFAVLDATTYTADMTDPAFQTAGPVWKKYYSAKEAYGKAASPPVTDPAAELTPSFWHQVTEAFERDQALFDAYIARKSRGWNAGSCTGDCKAAELCQMRAGRAQNNCFKPEPGVHLDKRRDDVDDKSGSQQGRGQPGNERGEHDECGVPVTLKTLSAVTDSKETLARLRSLVQGEKAAAAARRGEIS